MRPFDKSHFKLSTGKVIYAHRLMLGISRGADGSFEFGYGDDGDIPLEGHNYVDDYDYFTLEEQLEIALYAFSMWAEFLAHVARKKVVSNEANSP
jgi:hypothetical protein